MRRAEDVYRASKQWLGVVKPSPIVFEAARMTSATFLVLEAGPKHRRRKPITLAPVWVKK